MKALIIRGKKDGRIVTISQWCNDWFSLDPSEIVSPSSLAFTEKDMRTIQAHKNNGTLFLEFSVAHVVIKRPGKLAKYTLTFNRRRV